MKISLPVSVSAQIANSAARKARLYIASQGWRINGINGAVITPVFGVGYAGLTTNSKALMFQEKGTQPFLMKSLEGKTVPIEGADGETHFVRVKGVGLPGYVTLPTGQRIWRAQKWRNPGIKAKHFMADSVAAAMAENKDLIQSLMSTVIGYAGGIQP